MNKTISTLIAIFISQNSFALVDYSQIEGSSPAPSTPNVKRSAPPIVKRNAPAAASSSRSANNGPTSFELLTSYEQQKVAGQTTSGELNKLSLMAHFQTQYNLYLDVNYWAASNELSTNKQEGAYEKGNPKVILGFNWLRFGAVQEMATVDIYGGASFGGDEAVATTRTDKIVGVETSKRFYNFAIAIAYDYNLTGSPDSSKELTIGNISTLKTSLGWVVSGDISFVVEGGMVTVDNALNSESAYKLKEDVQFSYIKPSVQLGISPLVSLEMGGVFRSRRAKDVDTLVDAKLWDTPGAYGNSLFAGLKFSM
ncbi:hypothetical protein [Halobacteriovorax sp. HLS]|uniref:hypothetical protein n=1 Tax=Halobacteriovorax sp. HLS TaxID=2234000 RepID=UPI000FDA100C|nr:hypothetical protein [Halobacteriovorax sp. HLS]